MSPKPEREDTRQDLAKPDSPMPAEQRNDITVVAIGASAGGIEAVTELMNYLPIDTGMAFVLVQHLDPKHHQHSHRAARQEDRHDGNGGVPGRSAS